jgi:hypothetical protein
MLLRKIIEDLLLSLLKSVFLITTFSPFGTWTLNNNVITPASSQNYIWHPITNKMPIPVAERSKPWLGGHSPADTVGSNPEGFWMLCVTKYRFLRRSDQPYIGALPNVLLCCMWFRDIKNEEAMAVVWLQTDMKKITNKPYCLNCWYYS